MSEQKEEQEEEQPTLSFSNDSWIAHVKYNPNTSEMVITMAKGNEYACQGVSLELFNEFKSASSKGKYFNANIKGKYSHEYFE